MTSIGEKAAVGILVPEFPGQTHGFFWREIKWLETLGFRVEIASTRLPPDGIAARHEWADEARGRASQLTPIGAAGVCGSVVEGIRSWDSLGAVGRGTISLGNGSLARQLRAIGIAGMGLRLKQWCRSRSVRHIHVHSCADSAAIAAMCRACGGPTYSLVLHSPISCFGPNQDLKWSGAEFGVVVSRHVAEELKSLYGDSLPDEMLISSMGFDESVFRRSTPYSPPREGETLRLAACSRVSAGKGIDTLIEVVAALRQSGVDVELQVVGGCDSGPGSTMVRLQELSERLGVHSRVRFLGSCPATRIREVLEDAHLFVTATRQEAIGVAIMEAMAMGLPVVATKVGGIPELIEDGKSGVLVPVDSAEIMADAIVAISRNPGLAVALGNAASERVRSDYTSERSASRLAGVLRRRHPELLTSPSDALETGSQWA